MTTPLGQITADVELRDVLVAGCGIAEDHEKDNTVEIQLPLLPLPGAGSHGAGNEGAPIPKQRLPSGRPSRRLPLPLAAALRWLDPLTLHTMAATTAFLLQGAAPRLFDGCGGQ